MDRLSVPSLQGNTITPEHLGVNFNFAQDESGGTFGSRVDHLGSEVIRFPGGNVSELYFNPADPNNPIAIIQDGNGGIIREEVEPLDRFLDYLVATDKAGLFVIPTSRYIDGPTRFGTKTEDVLSQNAEDIIRTYVRQVLDSGAKVTGFEIGNEFNIWAQIDIAVYGRVASEMAVAVKAEIDDYEATATLPAGYETPLISMLLAPYYVTAGGDHTEAVVEMLDQLSPEAVDAISAFSQHRYIRGDYEQIDRFDPPWANFGLHADILGKDVEYIVSEWNLGANQQGIRDWAGASEAEKDTLDTGLKHAGAVAALFHEMAANGVDIATIWSLQQKSYVGLADREGRGGPEDLRAGGEVFKLLAETTIGMTPVALDRPSDDYDLHAFASEDAQVLVINGRSDGPQTVRIDMRALLGATGEAELNIIGVAPGDDPRDPEADPVVELTDGADALRNGILTLRLDPYEVAVLRVDAPGEAIDASTVDGIVFGGNGADVITGTARGDVIDGGLHDDVIVGGGGSDRLGGADGDDVVRGGMLNDTIQGGAGDDRLFGDRGVDRLFGQDGNDLMDGGASRDLLYGGDGDDTLIGGEGHDIFAGGAGRDTYLIRPGDEAWREQIVDFAPDEDRIVLGLEGLEFADLFLSQEESAAIIAFSGGSLSLSGVRVEDLDAENLLFE